VRCRPRAFSLWEKVSPKVTDEGRSCVFTLGLCSRDTVLRGHDKSCPYEHGKESARCHISSPRPILSAPKVLYYIIMSEFLLTKTLEKI
jgi:hypothetical protein